MWSDVGGDGGGGCAIGVGSGIDYKIKSLCNTRLSYNTLFINTKYNK